jgi:hypothetical protein
MSRHRSLGGSSNHAVQSWEQQLSEKWNAGEAVDVSRQSYSIKRVGMSHMCQENFVKRYC